MERFGASMMETVPIKHIAKNKPGCRYPICETATKWYLNKFSSSTCKLNLKIMIMTPQFSGAILNRTVTVKSEKYSEGEKFSKVVN